MVENEKKEVEEVNEESKSSSTATKKPKMIAVTLVSKSKGTALVEHKTKEGIVRVYVPYSSLSKGKIAEDELSAGIPYGIDWSQANIQQIDPKELDAAMKARGIWTFEDFNRNQMLVNRVILSLANANKAELLRLAKESEK